MAYVVRFEIEKGSNAYRIADHAYLVVEKGRPLSLGHHLEGRTSCIPNDKHRATRFDTIADAARALIEWDDNVHENGALKMWATAPQIVEG